MYVPVIIMAVAIRPAAGCLIQLLFVRQCSLLSTYTVNIRKYWNLEFFEDFVFNYI